MKLNNIYYEWLQDHYGCIGWNERFIKFINRVQNSMYKDDLKTGIKLYCKENKISIDKFNYFINH